MGIGDLVLDEHGEHGVITATSDQNYYVEVTFFGGLYGTIVCSVHKRFLTLVSKARKYETT
tara:strand:- start:242 stop:424 length:183 start_codon:yes stop_codon:yes gene_type:complete